MQDIMSRKEIPADVGDAFRGLCMVLTNIRLGDYIERSTANNSDLKYGEELITGVNSGGVFASPKGSTLGG